jgi:hypothetical protein
MTMPFHFVQPFRGILYTVSLCIFESSFINITDYVCLREGLLYLMNREIDVKGIAND